MLVGIYAVIHDIDVHLAASGEVVNQVVDHLLELAAATALVIGDHRAAALKIDRQRQVIHAAIGARVPVHGGTQVGADILDELRHLLMIDFALGRQ